MTKRYDKSLHRRAIALSVGLFLVGSAGLLYWGLGMPTSVGGFVMRSASSEILPFLVLPVVLLWAAGWLLTIRRPAQFQRYTLRRAAVVLSSAAGITWASQFIPFPTDYPGCCMLGPTRERGLPVIYMKATEQDFQASEPDFSHPSIIYLGIIVNLGYWMFALMYLDELHKRWRLVGAREGQL